MKAYLACVSFVDAQVGRLLDALDAGPNAGNTIVVLWGDHGWHLGEKQHWGKWTGWQRSTRVPLIIAPAVDSGGTRCAEPVSLLDLYPTLIGLCSLAPRDGLSGRSLAPLLKDPSQTTDRAVLTTFGRDNYSVTAVALHSLRGRQRGTLRPRRRSARMVKPCCRSQARRGQGGNGEVLAKGHLHARGEEEKEEVPVRQQLMPDRPISCIDTR